MIYAFALLFPLPLFLFTSPYAAVAGMTVAHGLQYLLLVVLVAAGTRQHDRWNAVTTLGAIAVFGGVLLNRMSHLHGSNAPERLLFGLYLGLLAGHFVVDAGTWRLQRPCVRAFLSERIPYLVPASPPRVAADPNALRLPIDRYPI